MTRSLFLLQSFIIVLVSAIMETVPAVEECVKQFHEVLHQGPPIEELPDIPNILMSDWYRDDIVNDEDFSREIVKSLKDTDETEWSVLLQNCTSQQVRLLEEFVGGSKLEDIFEHFDFDSTRGSRQEFSELEKLKPIELPVERPVKLISPSPIQAPKPSATEAQTGEEVLSQQRIQLDMYDEPGSKQPVLVDKCFRRIHKGWLNCDRHTSMLTSTTGVTPLITGPNTHVFQRLGMEYSRLSSLQSKMD